ncbi:hypothetical protein GCM10011613_19500 [Cellvibrio zantedeschiae]|uniref:Outer membrane protein beta-barrel domain-containing protein n=1 Tax=Cellvibrio zantedeschiae TaxID=1237077 RepID=A0ABQ3B278_9GAMM|nr:outer membrane beta-barrel protein [Cellvibrio zantedeschiae]GGY74237.1 hypothetical protein GCM10011613_19500 [Cellvibrio zantedeschiae]
MDKLKVLIITAMVSASASAAEASTSVDDLRFGLMLSKTKVDLDIGGESASQDVNATVLFVEKHITPRIAVHVDYKHINNDCDEVCADSTNLTRSVELSARFSQKPAEWLEVFGRAGVNYYSEKSFSSWHLAHFSSTESGFGPVVAAGFAVSLEKNIQLGIEYDVSFLRSSEKAAFASLFISMNY